MKPGMNSNQAPHNQSLVSSQQLQQQQQQQVQQQRVAVNHGQGGGQQQVDQYGRPVPQQHSGIVGILLRIFPSGLDFFR